MSRFYQDRQVANHVVELIREARKAVTLVSPYLDLWRHLKDELLLASKRGVAISVITRADTKVIEGDAVRWLLEAGFDVVTVEGLHAKAYLNESSVLVGSMNLTESSTNNSYEIAFDLDAPDQQFVREYVGSILWNRGKTLEKPKPWGKFVQRARDVAREMVAAADAVVKSTGRCVRCGRTIEWNPEWATPNSNRRDKP